MTQAEEMRAKQKAMKSSHPMGVDLPWIKSMKRSFVCLTKEAVDVAPT